MEDKKKILLICFDNPFVLPMEGGKRGMLSRIEAFSKMDYAVDIILLTKRSEFNNERKPIIENDRFNYYEFELKQTYKCVFSWYPLSVEKRLVEKCVEFLKARKYDVAIYEGEHVSEYRFKNFVNADRHILYMHDIESAYRLELSSTEENWVKRLAQKLESIKYKRLEKKISPNFDKLLFVSKDEKLAFEKEYNVPSDKTIYSPYALGDFADGIVVNSGKTNLLYIGNLKLKNNYLSILWFAKEIFPAIFEKNKNITLNIIGNIDDDNKKVLQHTCNNVTVNGYVDDLKKEIQDAALIISPVLYGAGVKVKLIDAISKGQVVVANKKATEGTNLANGKHLIVAETNEEFINYCLAVVENRNEFLNIAKEGLLFVKQEHSIGHHVEVLREAIVN